MPIIDESRGCYRHGWPAAVAIVALGALGCGGELSTADTIVTPNGAVSHTGPTQPSPAVSAIGEWPVLAPGDRERVYTFTGPSGPGGPPRSAPPGSPTAKPPPRPNIYVRGLAASFSGDYTTFSWVVCYTASARVPFSVKLWFHRATRPDCASRGPGAVVTTATMSGHVCQLAPAVRTRSVRGAKRAWLLVDSDCAVAETNERDNVASLPYLAP